MTADLAVEEEEVHHPLGDFAWFHEEDVSWMDDATCASIGGDLFFPDEDTDTDNTRLAKRTCLTCDVRGECLSFALRHKESGIWGGTNERQRRSLQEGKLQVSDLVRPCLGCERMIPAGQALYCDSLCAFRAGNRRQRKRKAKAA